MEINIEQLITEIRKHPAIWNMRCAEYADRNRKKMSWEEITINFVGDDASVHEKKNMGALLQKKWKHIRDRYSREVSERKGKSGKGAKKKPPYMYTQQLSFLADVIECRATDSSLDNVEIPDHTVTKEHPTPNVPSVGTKRRKGNLLENKLIEALENNMTPTEKKTTHEDDDDYHFLLSLLPSIKIIPPHLKLEARIEIMQCINKYTEFQGTSTQ